MVAQLPALAVEVLLISASRPSSQGSRGGVTLSAGSGCSMRRWSSREVKASVMFRCPPGVITTSM